MPAPVDDWDGGDEAATVRFERAGWSWAVRADPPLTTVESERVVDEVLDERPSWRPVDPPSLQPDLTDVPPAPGGPVPPLQTGGRVLWEGELHLHYGFYTLSSEDPTGAHEIRGQAQGLLSAADPGTVRAVAGLHTGALPLRIELHEQDPGVQPKWEEVVEASFTPYEEQVVLSAFDQSEQFALAPGTYRVRLCATGMDLGRDADTVLDDEPRPEHHRLQLWPEGEQRPDVLVRATSRAASYWHGRT